MTNRNEWSEGRSFNAAIGAPGSTTDCSDWESDLAADRWSMGHSTNAASGVPGSSTDSEAWETTDDIWMEVRLADTPAGAALPSSAPFLDAARTLAPELNLVADAGRTRRDGDTFILALTPTAALDDIEERLTQLIRQARSLSVGGARVTSAALCWAA